MLNFIKNLLTPKRKLYEAQRRQLAGGRAEDLQSLAAGSQTHPEILYYLARNEDAKIRKSVAENAMTPVQAATQLATDKDADVRLALAARLVKLLPGLSPEKHAQVYAYAVQALGMLAQDEVLSVRSALSSSLRDYAKAPPSVVSRLARDVEREVSEPILRYCAALPDSELIDILKQHPQPWVLSSIASRDTLSDDVAHAVFSANNPEAATVLLNNKRVRISEALLQKIVEQAPHYPEWHKPLALRPETTLQVARQLAGFVDRAVLGILERRGDFDPATRHGIAEMVKRRMNFQKEGMTEESAEQKIQRYISTSALSPDVVEDALAWHEKEFVFLSLSAMSGIPVQIVRKMISLGAAKPIAALCWKARLPMRLCTEIQRQLGHVPPKELMYAKGGTDYPMTPSEVKWQLEFFGIKA